jgi:hypothetical protein
MLATENATRLLARLTVIARAAEEALHAAEALEGADGAPGGTGDRGDRGDRGPSGMGAGGRVMAGLASYGGDWLPGIKESLRRIQLECADVTFALRELRETLPPPPARQPRPID